MIELGKVQELEILRTKEFGVYVGEGGDEASVLLPKSRFPREPRLGIRVEVFIYKDSSDRLIATTGKQSCRWGRLPCWRSRTWPLKSARFWTWGWRRTFCCPLRNRRTRSKGGEVSGDPLCGQEPPPGGYHAGSIPT